MSSEEIEFDGQLIEEFLRYLRGRGPRPQTNDLPDNDRVMHEDLFDLLEAIVDSDLVESPPLEEDPVALRLGVTAEGDDRGEVESAPHGLAELPPAIGSSLGDVAHELNNEVEVNAVRGNGELRREAYGLRILAECHSLGEVVLICSARSDELSAVPSSVAQMFAVYPVLTAIAVVSEVTSHAVVLTQADCVRAIDPVVGWVEPTLPAAPEPLELALRSYLEKSLPRWDEIARLDELLLLAHADEDITASVSEALSANLGRTAQIAAKKRALRDLESLAARPFEAVLVEVRARRLVGQDLIQRLREISEAEVG